MATDDGPEVGVGRQRLVLVVFGGNVGHGYHGQVTVEPQTQTWLLRASWARMSPWPQVTAHVSQAEITLVFLPSYPSYKVSLGEQHESSWWPRSWASARLLMVSGAMDINTDHGYNGAMDPDMASGCASGSGVITRTVNVYYFPSTCTFLCEHSDCT